MFKRIVSIMISAIMLISCLSALSASAASVDVAAAGAKLESTGSSKLDSFINDPRWTAGVSWNSAQRPKISSFNGWGCAAYCGDYVKYCCGSDNAKSGPVFYNASEIRAGDVITVGNPSNGRGHWFVVLKRSGDSLYVAEGNFNSMVRIGWNYSVSGNSIKGISYGFTAGYHYPVESTPAETVKPEAPSEPQPATEPKQDSGICYQFGIICHSV